MTRTIIEPFRISVVEPIRFTTREEREELLKAAHYNVFYLHADDVLIDLLTDSGTSAMSQEQWAGIMRGDESYAGASSFHRLKKVVDDLMGFKHFIPTHQGRAAERILYGLVGGPGKTIIANTHFDTTRANVEQSGAIGIDCLTPDAHDITKDCPFKGNMDLERLEAEIEKAGPENIGCVIVTVTNNTGGGQPVSMANIRAVRAIADKYGVRYFLDACRFAENAYFIREREEEFAGRPVREIAMEMFSYADGCTFSGKKDALVNMGGLLSINDDELAMRARNELILTEGFPTYGGMAGRDLEAMAIGLEEVTHEDYLEYRIATVRYLCEGLEKRGVPVMHPYGGHAAYVDARSVFPHLSRDNFPGWSLCNAVFLQGGIRAVEIGEVMFGEHAEHDLVRLALPRRVYTQSHVDYVIEVFGEVVENRENWPGYKMTYEPPYLRHFTAHFEPAR